MAYTINLIEVVKLDMLLLDFPFKHSTRQTDFNIINVLI